MATASTVVEDRIDADEAAAEKIRLAMYAPEPETADTQGETGAADATGTEGADTEETPPPSEKTEVKDEGEDGESGPPDESATPELDADKEASFEKKFLTLKGKFDKEVPKAAKELKTVRKELKDWQGYAQTLEFRIKEYETAAADKAKTVSEPGPEKKVEKDVALDLEDPELQTLVGDYPGIGKILTTLTAERKADKERIAALEKLITSSSDKLKAIETDVGSSRVSRFDSEMIARVGVNWKEIDTDPEFIEFLNEEVPYTSRTKLEFLKTASARYDAPRVAKFFLDYLATLGKKGADGESNGNGSPGSDKLKKFVAPPRSGGAPPAERRALDAVHTRIEYQRFMDETMKGKFNPKSWGGKTEAEMDAIFDKAIATNSLQ